MTGVRLARLDAKLALLRTGPPRYSEHRVAARPEEYVFRGETRFEAECSCGKRFPSRRVEADAVADGRAHAAEVAAS